MSKAKVAICPYCGQTQPAGDVCRACGGLFEPLSRQATQNDMGPWYIRNPARPFQPGCSYETLVRLIERNIINRFTIIRGPTTKQFWTVARRIPGLAHLFGYCHNCDAAVETTAHGCHKCGVPFGAYLDRNHLGLADVKPLPWEAPLVEAGATNSGGAASDGGPVMTPRTGISSFASDAELTGPIAGANVPMAADLAVMPGLGAASAGMTSVVDPGPTAAQQAASSRALQNLQRRLENQQRTNRTLMIALIIVGLIALIAAWRAMGSGEPAGNGSSGPATAPAEQSQRPGATGAPANDRNPANGRPGTRPTAPPNTPAAAPETPATAAASAPQASRPSDESTDHSAASIAADVEDALADADQAITQGKDESRAIETRIAACGAALDRLRVLEPSVPESHMAEYQQVRTALQREYDRLQLKKFFP